MAKVQGMFSGKRRMKTAGSAHHKAYLALWPYITLGLFFAICLQIQGQAQLPWQSAFRTDRLLDQNWQSAADTSGSHRFQNFQKKSFEVTATSGWQQVNLPHNWDDYGGYIRKKHGNRHGDAWYRKTFDAPCPKDKSSFLFFEGVSSYCSVYLNGHLVGKHSGGRTSFTLAVSEYLNKNGRGNLLAVKVEHPAFIRDLPWVCGGCSDEVGFSEGSQPMGIFRPVHLIQTGNVRIRPFGVHIYNDTTACAHKATLQVATTFKNFSPVKKQVVVLQQLLDKAGQVVAKSKQSAQIDTKQNNTLQLHCQLKLSHNVHLWSLDSPYLYQLKTTLLDKKSAKVLDELTTPYGIRWIRWPDLNKQGPKQFLLNGKPVFINGIAGYEHALGKSHAFTKQEIASRVAMIRAMGFNAFRDAHQPHNLRYQYYWAHLGVLWWPQFSAHIWFDTPAFRKHFLSLLRDWVLERRNNPANIMWGLQNESRLPEDFARQCVALIRSLDPTASSQRLITTCNGGQGTDWDVPQNWSGTYGGDPDNYGKDLKQEVLVGEYGGWRTLDLHTEGGFHAGGPYSMDSWCALLEKKIRLADQVKTTVCGHFLWLFNSHDNPGRVQAAEGYRDLDRTGPVNYKGLLTSWEEPTEAFYLYQANFTGADKAPMVHIGAHQWVERWTNKAEKKDIIVYSNCDSVILYNGLGERTLGSRVKGAVGTHFSWKQVQLQYNVLYAVGYYNGQAVVTDQVLLNNLPVAPELQVANKKTERNLKGRHPQRQAKTDKNSEAHTKDVLRPLEGYHYLYRYNAGGGAYRDSYGNLWSADRNIAPKDTARLFGSLSWTAAYKGLPAYFASQRYISDPIKNTTSDKLFQTFRYGRQQLKFNFPVQNGDYLVTLYFVEPWWGVGSRIDCSGWRDFDVAINQKVVLHHLDIYKEAGSLRALKKQFNVHVQNGRIGINFPRTYSGQAVISAVAIAQKKRNTGARQNKAYRVAAAPAPILAVQRQAGVQAGNANAYQISDWLAAGDDFLLKVNNQTINNGFKRVHISNLPPALFGAQWLQRKATSQNKGYLDAKLNRKQSKGESGVYWRAAKPLQLYVAAPYRDSMLQNDLKDQGFVDTKSKIDIILPGENGGTSDSLHVFQKDIKAGANLQQKQWWPSCLLAFKPVSQMQPPYDQKPVITYGVADASFSKGAQRVKREQKDCLLFTGKPTWSLGTTKQFCSWDFVTGVADFHSFQLKYAYSGKDSLAVRLTLLAADGKVMATADTWMLPTKKGKWNSCYLLTPTMVNAGHYILKISWQPSKQTPLYIYSMKLR